MATFEGDTYCPNCVCYRPNRPTYDKWMAEVDDALVRKVGVSSADMPDICYRDLYDSGYSPEEAADEAIENSMT
jgi:hypothetical protein